MTETKPIVELVDALPEQSVTTYVLDALDFVVPGEWENLTGFDNTVRAVTGQADVAAIQRIRQRASDLYADPASGYQKAVWVYPLTRDFRRQLCTVTPAS